MEGVCVFCRRGGLPSEEVGETFTKHGITVHQFCLYFSSGLYQSGAEEEGISGFLLTDILAEVKRGVRGRRLKCAVCKQPGGYVGCSNHRCRRVGHFPCLRSAGFLFQHFENFLTYCPQHRPWQPPLATPNSQDICCICLSRLGAWDGGLTSLYCPCCKTLLHMSCIQKQAWTAGSYYFRCPVCSSSDVFLRAMLEMGVHVPQRDAGWETSGQFQDLYEETKFCHARLCICPEGRGFSTQLGKYRMRKCSTCGQWLGHLQCLRGTDVECADCSVMLPSTRPSLSRGLTTSTPSYPHTSTPSHTHISPLPPPTITYNVSRITPSPRHTSPPTSLTTLNFAAEETTNGISEHQEHNMMPTEIDTAYLSQVNDRTSSFFDFSFPNVLTERLAECVLGEEDSWLLSESNTPCTSPVAELVSGWSDTEIIDVVSVVDGNRPPLLNPAISGPTTPLAGDNGAYPNYLTVNMSCLHPATPRSDENYPDIVVSNSLPSSTCPSPLFHCQCSLCLSGVAYKSDSIEGGVTIREDPDVTAPEEGDGGGGPLSLYTSSDPPATAPERKSGGAGKGVAAVSGKKRPHRLRRRKVRRKIIRKPLVKKTASLVVRIDRAKLEKWSVQGPLSVPPPPPPPPPPPLLRRVLASVQVERLRVSDVKLLNQLKKSTSIATPSLRSSSKLSSLSPSADNGSLRMTPSMVTRGQTSKTVRNNLRSVRYPHRRKPTDMATLR